ncbi:ABC transporter, solute-binding protein [Winkia neuii]|uniref:ABC transporter substrate-binding protein n=1 Tax=Winkia neuii TaxID=33007 RepID=UPI000763F76D|nr:sugar ABC transporter substrate-binding protein [Winkia neuii]KWZ72209.1 ABC transporter, solute-binding protein [Winkia neuii]
MKKQIAIASLAALTCVGLAACTPEEAKNDGVAGKGDGVTLTYSLWDPNQKPAYEKCAAEFTKKTGVKIKIDQKGWDDYWQNLTVALNSGSAPDVITNHVAHYPELAKKGVLADISENVKKDKVDLSGYTGELADLWVKDGKRYGIPQDWDTIALVYNVKDIEEAGYKAEDLKYLNWNPTDGGTFGKLIAHLTIDENGKRGDEPGFDKKKVKTYGWGLETGGGVVGQGPWSWLALSNGFNYLDKNPFGTQYKLDDPKLAEALGWMQKQIEAGYVTPVEKAGDLGLEPMMEQNKAALVPDGSWRINTWAQSKAQKFAFAPLPAGPAGRKTIINGLAPSITRDSKHPNEAWQWVKFLTSNDCQSIVAGEAVVFPSLTKQSEAAAKAHSERGVDVSPFLDITKNKEALSYYPITYKADEINSEADVSIEKIQRVKVDPATELKQLNQKVNKLLQE